MSDKVYLCWLCAKNPQPAPGEFCDDCNAMLEFLNYQLNVSTGRPKKVDNVTILCYDQEEIKTPSAMLETSDGSPAKGPPKHE